MEKREYLKGKNVVITGGSGILCREFAYSLAQHGANVAVLGRTVSKLDEVVDEIRRLGGVGLTVACDVVNRKSVEDAKSIINDKFGRVDILINGAGGNHPQGNTTKEIFEDGDIEDSGINSFFDLSSENFGYVFDLNMLGTLIPTQIFMKDLINNEGSCVLNMSSMSAYHPMTKVSAYSAAKAAVTNFTEWLAVHFAQNGVRVNALAPGFFITEQNKRLMTNEDGTYTDRAKKVIAHTPMKRFGVPADLVGTMLWLVDSSQSAFVTGATVPVDGGFNAYSGV